MAGKYDHLKEKYPKLQIDPSDQYSDKVQKLYLQLRQENTDRRFILKQIKELRFERDALKARLSEQGIELKAREMWLDEFLEDEQLTAIKDDEGFTFRTQAEPVASVIDFSEFKRWAETSGWIAQFTMNYQTLNANVKQLILDNQPTPPGIGVWMKNKIVVSKPR